MPEYPLLDFAASRRKLAIVASAIVLVIALGFWPCRRYGVAEKTKGDVVKATIIGHVITVYINGVQTLQATDDTFTSGSPGIGFYIEGATGVNANFGFSNFTATDDPTH